MVERVLVVELGAMETRVLLLKTQEGGEAMTLFLH